MSVDSFQESNTDSHISLTPPKYPSSVPTESHVIPPSPSPKNNNSNSNEDNKNFKNHPIHFPQAPGVSFGTSEEERLGKKDTSDRSRFFFCFVFFVSFGGKCAISTRGNKCVSRKILCGALRRRSFCHGAVLLSFMTDWPLI